MIPKLLSITHFECESLTEHELNLFNDVFVWSDPFWLYYPTVRNKRIVLTIIKNMLSDYNAADDSPKAKTRRQITEYLIEVMADVNYSTNQ